jgi:uncharacterized GH25 family protein/ketosteroid isomerase-like protein
MLVLSIGGIQVSPAIRSPRRTRLCASAALAAGVVLLGSASWAFAHDFWLVPDAFHIASGGTLTVRGQTSSHFPESESAVAVDRVVEARVMAADGETRITDLSRSGTSLLLRHVPRGEGQRVVAVRLAPLTVREASAGFRRYMELEGAPELAARYEREGLLPKTDSITRRYAKYAKTVVEVGRGGPRAFATIAGHHVEFVPLSDPAELRAGDTLAVRLLYVGQPLAGAYVRAGAAAREAAGVKGKETDPASAGAARAEDLVLSTDAEGVARVPVAQSGLWNVRTIHIVPADAGPGADWDVHWTTLVFDVASGAGARLDGGSPADATPTRAAQDSAAVAAVVQAYDRALQSGDSAAALALLAPDAVILENGSMETREEYRSHHLASDIAFARATLSTPGGTRIVVRGDVAWAISTSTTTGQYRDRAVNSTGAELMVLTREPTGWKIRAIHWSSRARPAQ